MLSRIADSLFWLNRYMERCDGLLRAVKTHYILLLDKGVNENLSWQPLLEIFTTCDETEIALLKDNTEASLHKLLLDSTNPNALKVMLTKARENARGVQDHITKEVWEQVNQMYHFINNVKSDVQLKSYEVMATIDTLSKDSILYSGVSGTTMPRGLGWSFMNIGQYIERAMLTLEMSDKYFAEVDYDPDAQNDILQWRPLLLSLSGYELHLKNYRSNCYSRNALHQVMFNEHFTRSVLYTLERVNKYFRQAIQNNQGYETELLSRQLGRLTSRIRYADFNSLNQHTLQPFLQETRKEIMEFSTQLAQYFFSYY